MHIHSSVPFVQPPLDAAVISPPHSCAPSTREEVWEGVGQAIVDAARLVLGSENLRVTRKSEFQVINGDESARHTVTLGPIEPVKILGARLPLLRKSPVMSISLEATDSRRYGLQAGNLIFLVKSEELRDLASEIGIKAHELIAQRGLTLMEPLMPFWVEVSAKLR